MEKTTINDKELKYKIEIATQTLDRNIGFVTNCDNKTSIVLATFGVLIAIILTNEGLNKILNIVKNCVEVKNFCNILYLICFFGSILTILLGFINLGSVLMAKTSEYAVGKKDTNSKIFFTGIKKSGDCRSYSYSFNTMSNEDLLNDLISQIYINADIASTKYSRYNRGLRFVVIGFLLFVIFLLIGIYIY